MRNLINEVWAIGRIPFLFSYKQIEDSVFSWCYLMLFLAYLCFFWAYFVFTEAFGKKSVSKHVTIRIALATMIPVKQERNLSDWLSPTQTRSHRRTRLSLLNMETERDKNNRILPPASLRSQKLKKLVCYTKSKKEGQDNEKRGRCSMLQQPNDGFYDTVKRHWTIHLSHSPRFKFTTF